MKFKSIDLVTRAGLALTVAAIARGAHLAHTDAAIFKRKRFLASHA